MRSWMTCVLHVAKPFTSVTQLTACPLRQVAEAPLWLAERSSSPNVTGSGQDLCLGVGVGCPKRDILLGLE